MTVLSIPRESIERISTMISADNDPTQQNVEFAFTVNEDRPSTWEPGLWDGAATLRHGRYRAKALSPILGTGAIDLLPGTYQVWVKLDGPFEDPVIRAGAMIIT